MESSCYVALRRMTRSGTGGGGRGEGGWRPTVVDIGSFAADVGEGPAPRRHIPHNQVAGTRCDKVSPAPDTYIFVCTYIYICVCTYICARIPRVSRQTETGVIALRMPIRATTPFVKATPSFGVDTPRQRGYAPMFDVFSAAGSGGS